jgi:hypothetical protein
MTGMITTEIGMVGIIAIRGIGTVMSEETGTIGTTVTGIKTEALLLIRGTPYSITHGPQNSFLADKSARPTCTDGLK